MEHGADIGVLVVDDFLDLMVGVGFEDDCLEFEAGLQFAIETEGEVDDVGNEYEDDLGVADLEPIQHVVEEVLIVDELIDLVQYDDFSFLARPSPTLLEPLPQHRVGVPFLLDFEDFGEDSSADVVGRPHAHAV